MNNSYSLGKLNFPKAEYSQIVFKMFKMYLKIAQHMTIYITLNSKILFAYRTEYRLTLKLLKSA